MVLETIMSIRDAIKNPWHMVIFGAIISLVSLGVAYLVFPQYLGILTVFLITIISAPFMFNLLKYEEAREEIEVEKVSFVQRINPISAFSRQSETFVIYSAFFAGMVIALSLAFVVLPQNFVSELFNEQISQIGKINLILGGATFGDTFGKIVQNNLVVMAVAFVFALLFGIGAIFILAWNASVLAAAIGIVTKSSGVTDALVTFLPHGVFEIAAYFVAGIAGGIISVAISKRGSKDFGLVVGDMVVLMVLSVALVIVGAYIETIPIT